MDTQLNDKSNNKKRTKVPKEVKEEVEKRQRPYRPTASIKVSERIIRAKTERLYLLEMKEISVTHRYEYRGGDGDIRQFFVLFTTGNVYTVDISNKNTCTCPDALKGNLCKHVLFVMLKVLRVDPNDSCVWQTALLNSELHSIFTNAPPAPRDVYAAARARDGYQNMVKGEAPPSSSGASNRRPIEGQDCPICFDSLNVSDDIVFCEDCGNNMHKDCMRRWTSLNPTCPFCRAQWKSERLAPGAPHVGDEGYVNLARLQPGTDASRQYNPNKWRENLW